MNLVGNGFYKAKKTYKCYTTLVIQSGAIELSNTSLVNNVLTENNFPNTHHQRDESWESFFYLSCDALTNRG